MNVIHLTNVIQLIFIQPVTWLSVKKKVQAKTACNDYSDAWIYGKISYLTQ